MIKKGITILPIFLVGMLIFGGFRLARAATIYSVTGLGDLPGGILSSAAWGINDNGQVVGRSISASGYEAFIWDSVTGMIGLGDLAGGSFLSEAWGINNSG